MNQSNGRVLSIPSSTSIPMFFGPALTNYTKNRAGIMSFRISPDLSPCPVHLPLKGDIKCLKNIY